jgi:hypothetical protein
MLRPASVVYGLRFGKHFVFHNRIARPAEEKWQVFRPRVAPSGAFG